MKEEKHASRKYKIIAAVLSTALLIIAAVILPRRDGAENKAPARIIAVGEKSYTYREYLVGCIAAQLKALDAAPSQRDMAGINAVAAAVNCSLSYLCDRGGITREFFPYVEFMDSDARAGYFGEKEAAYTAAAEAAADYALKTEVSYKGETVFLPVCRISSGALIAPRDMPWVKKLYCPRDKYAPRYKGGCQLTSDGIASVLLAKYRELVLPPNRDAWISDIVTDSDKNVLSLKVCGITVSGYEFCALFGIRSVCFEVSCSQGLYTFQTMGDGESTGMSVFAAVQLSREGAAPEEILRSFFDVDISAG